MPDVQSESEDDEEEDVIIDIAGKEDSSNTSSEGEEIQDTSLLCNKEWKINSNLGLYKIQM